LDLRLADGRPPGQALAGEERLVRSFDVGGSPTAATDLAPWRARNASFHSATSGLGTGVRAREYRPEAGVVHAAFEFAEDLRAEQFNRIELDLVSFSNGNATLTWESDERPGDVPLGSLRVDAVTRAGRPQTLVLSMVGHPAWRGTIRKLRLFPCWKGPQSYELRAIRFLQGNFDGGPDPSSEFASPGGDSGLMGPSRDKRRAWPSDVGVPLFVLLDAQHADSFQVEVSATDVPGQERDQATVFSVEARVHTAAEAAWEEVARTSFAADTPRPLSWRTLRADLSAWRGMELELRLRAWRGVAPPQPGSGRLLRGSMLWANPMVFDPQPDSPPSDLILVTLDTLRADALGCYGGPPDTPFLDHLAAQGIRFEEALSACNSTLPAHTSILTGQPVPTHGVLDNRSTLAPDVRTLAQVLRQSGYLTAAAVSVEHLQPSWSGLGRGFDRFLEVAPGATLDGALTLEGVEEWLAEWGAGPRPPLFLWVHLFDPHTPYGPPPEFRQKYEARLARTGDGVPPRAADPPSVGITTLTREGEFLHGVSNGAFARHLYRASVAYTDHLVERLVGGLTRAGIWDRALAVITADHGESLGEQNVWYNHQRIHPAVMSIPLIVHLPGQSAGSVSGARASNADIARTLGRWAGVRAEDWGAQQQPAGLDLIALAQDADGASRRVWFVHSNQAQVGCRDGDVYYFHNLTEYLQLGPDRAQPAGMEFLYRHGPDPGSAHNLAGVHPELAAQYQNAMRAWLERVSGGRHVRADLSPEQEDQMRAMGYGGDGEDGQ
jgi:arylsulfatase A-like enzyme